MTIVSVSTVPAVKLKLRELFEAAVEPPTEVWPVMDPAEEHQLAENIYIGSARGTREYRTVGAPSPNGRAEVYGVEVKVDVYREGTDFTGTEARLFEIVQALETALAENPRLTNSQNVSWSIVGAFEQETLSASDGVLSSYPFTVHVEARI